jgi:biopolymer transport protein ExbB
MTAGELFSQAGWPMWPIYACSLVAVAVFVRKLLQLHAARLSDMRWLDPALEGVRAGDFAAAQRACAGVPHPAASAVSATARMIPRRPDRAEAEGYRVGGLVLQRLEARLSVLSFIAQAAPLLGLLGTVFGMVDLFMGIEGSGLGNLDSSLLSAGIWKALLTTAAGLLVALPTMAAHAYLTSRTDGLRLLMSDAIQRVLSEAPASAVAPAAERSDESPRRVGHAV